MTRHILKEAERNYTFEEAKKTTEKVRDHIMSSINHIMETANQNLHCLIQEYLNIILKHMLGNNAERICQYQSNIPMQNR